MARHRRTPARVSFLARSRRPALLGGALGGGTALVIGLTAFAVVSASSDGVHFSFSDRADAAVIGRTHDIPTVSRDLGSAVSPTPRPTPSSAPATSSSAQGQRDAMQPSAAPSSVPTAAASAPSASATPSPSATASAASSPAATSSPSPTSTPAQTAAPIQLPTPAPTDPGSSGSGKHCLLGIICA